MGRRGKNSLFGDPASKLRLGREKKKENCEGNSRVMSYKKNESARKDSLTRRVLFGTKHLEVVEVGGGGRVKGSHAD